MGVSGSGKSTVCRSLSEKTENSIFIEGDDFHGEDNISKMKRGIGLTDEDRIPWLLRINKAIESVSEPNVFISCSALRKSYREILALGQNRVSFIYLKCSKDQLKQRLDQRKNHFFNAALLEDQLLVLEEPDLSENCLTVPCGHKTKKQIIDFIVANFTLTNIKHNTSTLLSD